MSDDHYFQRWDPDEHAELLGSWYRAHGTGPDCGDLSAIPPTGFVVDGIVAGFVYITNCSVAVMDQWVSDPHSTKAARRAALAELFELLCECAKEHGAKIITMGSPVRSVMEQSVEHGFELSPNPFQFSYRSL